MTHIAKPDLISSNEVSCFWLIHSHLKPITGVNWVGFAFEASLLLKLEDPALT